MTVSQNVRVLQFNEYLGRDSQTVYETRYFCGACRREIEGCYAFPSYPEALEAKNEADFLSGLCEREDAELELDYFAYCPWCGGKFADEWANDRTIQNERAIDHYQNPGTHKGDTHEFRGEGPDCVAGHWLGVSGGDEICWCGPEVEAGIMGCTIRHQDKRFEDVMALRRELEPAEAEEHEDEWCE